MASERVYFEGLLLKRPRARTSRPHVMRFQERFCRLTLSSLEYYEVKGKKDQFKPGRGDLPKGYFAVKCIKLVEEVQYPIFRKNFCFQVGDENEIMYLAASSKATRTKWIEALRQVAADSGNRMLQWYHVGVFGKTLSHPTPCWSCCKITHETSIGCKKTTGTPTNTQSLPNRLPTSLIEYGYSPFRSRASTGRTIDSGRGESVRFSLITNFSDSDSLYSLQDPPNEEGTKGNQMKYGSRNRLSTTLAEEVEPTQETTTSDLHDIPCIDSGFSEQLKWNQGDSPAAISNTKHPHSESTIPTPTESTASPNDPDYEQNVNDILSVNVEDAYVNKTTILHIACKKGVKSVVQLFLQNSEVDVNPADELHRTPLHEAAMAGHFDIVKLLLEKKANPFSKDKNNETPYDLAMKENHKEVMDILQDSMLPATAMCTYTPLPSPSHFASHSVERLVFYDDSTLISTSMSSVQTWDIPDLTPDGNVETAHEYGISSLSVWGTYLAIGSNFIQIFDLGSEEGRIVFIADEEPLLNPSTQLVAFGPRGHLATVNSESKIVKVWPPPSQTDEFITKPIWTSDSTLDSGEGSICSLSVSTSDDENESWLAVGTSKGHVHVHLLKWKKTSVSEESHHFLYTGVGSGDEVTCTVLIPHGGRNVATGCGSQLLIREIQSETTIHDLTDHTRDGAISSLCYSPDDAHLAVGMSTGEVVVYEAESGSPIITLEPVKNSISAMAYSGSGSYFSAGYNNGKIQLWTTKRNHSPMIIRSVTGENMYEPEEPTEPTFCSDLPLIGREEGEIESREEEYTKEFLDYKIVIPANATHGGRTIPYQTGEMPFGPVGPFKFPPNTKPVSSIIWFHSNKMSDLQKPIKIVLSHCLNYKSDDDLKPLVFMKAGGDDYIINQNGEKEFTFRELREEEKEEEPSFTSVNGTLITRYCCWKCICLKTDRELREEIDNVRYCLTDAVSHHATEGKREIRFILHYDLLPCVMTINEHYGEKNKLNSNPVTFSSRGPDPRIQIGFESFKLPEGWMLLRKTAQNIPVKKVHFLDMYRTRDKFAYDVSLHKYPPSVLLVASGRQASGDTVVSIKITGADEELEVDILLEKPNQEQTPEPGSEAAAVVSVDNSIAGIGDKPAQQTNTLLPVQCTQDSLVEKQSLAEHDSEPWQSLYYVSVGSQQQHSPVFSPLLETNMLGTAPVHRRIIENF